MADPIARSVDFKLHHYPAISTLVYFSHIEYDDRFVNFSRRL